MDNIAHMPSNRKYQFLGWGVMQEVGSYRPAVRPERRRQMQQEVVDAAPHALQVLASCLNQKGTLSTGHHTRLLNDKALPATSSVKQRHAIVRALLC